MAVTKKAKRSPVKKAVKKAADASAKKITSRTSRGTADQQKEVVRLRQKDGLKWHEIASFMGVTTGKAIHIYNCATIEPLEAKTESGMATAIVKARKSGESWGVIVARTGLSETKVRSLYTDKTEESTKGMRIGKGGRYPADANPNKDKPKPAKKAAAKKAAPKKAAAKKAPAKKAAAKKSGRKNSLEKLSFDDLASKLTGKQIKMSNGTVIPVESVTQHDEPGMVTLVNGEDGPLDVRVADIKSAVVN